MGLSGVSKPVQFKKAHLSNAVLPGCPVVKISAGIAVCLIQITVYALYRQDNNGQVIMAIVSISQAAKLVRKGRQTLYNHNDKGKLSFTKTEDGKPGIDTSELERVYGKLYMPANKMKTVGQDSNSETDNVRQHEKNGQGRQDNVQSEVSNTVSLDSDTASTLSWFIEQVDETKQELAETQAELEDKENRLAELREAMAKLPSPETVERRLAEQAAKLKQKHTQELETERQQHTKQLAQQKHQEAKQAEQWQQAIAERKLEIKQAKIDADAIRQREHEQATALKREQERVQALESRGLIARLLNKKPALTN